MLNHQKTIETITDHILRTDPILETWKENFTNVNSLISEDSSCRISWLNKDIVSSLTPETLRTFLIVGAGSSLDYNISLVSQKKDRFTIICTDAAFPALIDAGIEPNIVVMTDPSDLIAKFYIYKKIDTSSMLLVAPATSSIKALKAWRGKIYLYAQREDRDKYKKEVLETIIKAIPENTLRLNIRGFVGYTAIDLAVLLKARRIIMVGMDFCFLNGNFYCDSTLKSKFGKHWRSTASKKFKEFKNSGEYIYLGSDKELDTVCTSRSMHYYAQVLYKYLPDDVKKICINCSHEFWSDIINYSDFSDICRGMVSE